MPLKVYVSFTKHDDSESIYYISVGSGVRVGYLTKVFATTQCQLNIYMSPDHEIGECYDTFELAKESAINQIKKMFKRLMSKPEKPDVNKIEIEI
jgi:hypothetical protein